MKLLIILVFLSSLLSAQMQLKVTDEHDKPIEFAHVQLLNKDSMNINLVLTNIQGIVDIDDNHAVKAYVSHLGYQPRITDLQRGMNVIKLSSIAVQLNQVVITAQMSENSPEKAVEKVTIIPKKKIETMGANTLDEVLRNETNLRLSQDNILGTGMSMQGMGGQNVKIMIDGVPVIGRLNGNVDLSQINMNDVERIEMVQGPLSVNYGTDALAGTINIITKKNTTKKYEGDVNVFTESLGRINSNGQLLWGKDRTYKVAIGRTYFDGWNPNDPIFLIERERYADTTRFQEWKPKEQVFGRASIGQKIGSMNYRLQTHLFQEIIDNKGMPRAPYYEIAFDDIYQTFRWDNQVTIDGKINENYRLDVVASYNHFERIKNSYRRDLTTLEATMLDLPTEHDTSTFSMLMSRGTISRVKADAKLNYQLGYDVKQEGTYGRRINGSSRSIAEFAGFAAAEYKATDKLVLKPGIRWGHNTGYDHPVIPSIHLAYEVGAWKLRTSFARGFRAPSLKQLYFNFVDVNHNIQGNPNLDAETSESYQFNLGYRKIKESSVIQFDFGGFYNDVDNLITMANSEGTAFSYFNVLRFQTFGGQANASYSYQHLKLTVGGTYTGNTSLFEGGNEFIAFSPEFRSNLQYEIKKWHTGFSVFYKYNGEQPGFFEDGDGNIQNSMIAGFHMLDATVNKDFLNKRLNITTGAKNILNVQNIFAQGPTGAHSSNTNSMAMANGITFFCSAKYRFHAN